jgi:hypothetical protein
MANGIMDLPQGQPQMQQLSSADTYDAATTALGTVNPAQLQQYKAAIQQSIAQLQLTPEQIDQMIQVFEYLTQNKERYPEALQQLVQQGVLEAGDLPEQFDPQLMGVIIMVLHELKAKGGAQQPQVPSQFAEGGLADAARYLQNQGRNGDTILAHINPQEAAILKAMGGSGTINPHTGLPEFGWNPFKAVSNAISSVAKSVVNVAKDVLASPIGQIVGTIALATVLGPAGLGLSMPMAAGLAGAGTSLLAGGDLKSALVSGALGYFGGGGGIGGFNPSQAIQGLLPAGSSAFLSKALTGGAIGTLGGLIQGKTIGESLGQGIKGAAMSGVAAAAQGALPASTSGPQAPAPVSDAVPSVNATGATGTVGTAAAPTPNLVTPPAEAAMYNANAYNGAVDAASNGTWEPPDAYNKAVDAASNGTWESPATPPAPRTGIQGLLDTANEYKTRAMDYLTRGGDTQAEVDAAKAEAGQRAVANARSITLKPLSSDLEYKIYTDAANAAGPGTLATYGPTAAILGGVAMASGAGKPVPVNKEPLYKPQTGQDYINANPQIFGQWKAFGEPGVAAPTSTGFVPTVGPQPRGLASLQAAPLYTPPTAAVTGGQPLNQPYNIAGMYRIPVYNRADGGSINNPMFSGTHPTGMTSAFASGGQYPRRSGAIDGPGTGTSDSIPAMLSDGEFVFTAKAVRNAGGGSRRAGAKKMYQLMQKLERGGKVQGA